MRLKAISFGLLLGVFYVACGNIGNSSSGIGQIFQARLSDSTLLLYSIVDRKGYASGSGGRSRSTTYEEATLSALRLNGTNIEPLYQVPTPCNQDDCGTYNLDRVLTVGKRYWVMACHCTRDFVVVEVATGAVWCRSSQLKDKFPELASGIAEWEKNHHLDALTLTLNNGKVYMLSMNDLQLRPYSEGKFTAACMDGEIPATIALASMANHNYYFDMNTEDKQSFLVVRGVHSGTSQSRLYRTGEAWLCPDFLADAQRCEPFIYNNNLIVLHAQRWNDALEKDLLTVIDEKGARKFTIPIDSLGKGKPKLISKNQYVYALSPKMISILDIEKGQIVQRVEHSTWYKKK